MLSVIEQRAPEDRTRIAPWILALVISAGALWVDVTAKEWASEALAEPVRITSWFYLALYYNPGLFFGTVPVSAVTMGHWVFICGGLVWIGWRMRRAGSLTIGAGYALVAGGLVGNAFGRAQGAVVDYLVVGPVVDGKWVYANLADLFLLSGGLLLGAVLVRNKMKTRQRSGRKA